MTKPSCKCKVDCDKLSGIEKKNNPSPKLLMKKGFCYHIRALLNQEEDCLLDLWLNESLVKGADADELGQELIRAIQQVMDKYTSPNSVGRC